MLIDAAHPEETRVVVLRNNKIEEFDYESASRKQIRGNIYLAKVTRVEPSLQAAFVDYGGNRHGFLAFSEIHPDYYQIPIADRQALLEAEADMQRSSADDADNGNGGDGSDNRDSTSDDDDGNGEHGDEDGDGDGRNIESVGAEDAMEELPEHRRPIRRSYKIQEVIKRRQILLVQVVKEERGNKGAALTTYLSLAGRYCVLMPNTARGGGISRKITDSGDRRRLKDVAKSIEVPEGMGLIVRTAGANRTKLEIKRDYDYLLRLWETIRELTLQSTAPNLVYEEGSLIKRAIRDLYTKDVDTVLVEGDAAYREAKAFMKMLMPSHARNVKPYKENRPLFSRHQVENQLDGLFSPIVTMQSGGYIVINQTEALVSIDVNSGKSTREHNIEDTALKTNIEAAEEVARQLRLRDLAGLIVIDFIDMEEKRNNRTVERRLKEVLKHDRARIQVGRISHFGLLEMSRQRLRVGMLEGSTLLCPHCEGHGFVRSVESCALSVLRGVEEHILQRRAEDITVRCERDVGFYLLNQKRGHVLRLEAAYGVSIFLEPSSEQKASQFKIERAEPRLQRLDLIQAVQIDSAFAESDEEDRKAELAEETAQPESAVEEQAKSGEDTKEDGERRRRRRRRGQRGGRRNRGRTEAPASAQADAVSDPVNPGNNVQQLETEVSDGLEAPELPPAQGATAMAPDGETSAAPARTDKKKRRRNVRSRRREDETVETEAEGTADTDEARVSGDEIADTGAAPDETAAKPKRRRPSRKKAAKAPADQEEAPLEAATPAGEKPKPKRTRKSATTKTPDDVKAIPETGPDGEPGGKAATGRDAASDMSEAPDRPRKTPSNGRPAAASDEAAERPQPAAETAASDGEKQGDDDRPAEKKKRGWWQRALLGG